MRDTLYRVTLRPAARRDADALEPLLWKRIEKALDVLSHEPRPRGAAKLHGAEKAWRIRVGDYRVLYEVDNAARTVTIFRIAHRREAYR